MWSPTKMDMFRHANLYFYRPQTKFAKVMFLHVSVILSMGGGVSRPRPRGEVGWSGQGGVQAQAREVVSRPRPRPGGGGGVQAQVRGGVQAQARECVYPSMHWGRSPPADGYCCWWYASYWNAFLLIHILLQISTIRYFFAQWVYVIFPVILFQFGLNFIQELLTSWYGTKTCRVKLLVDLNVKMFAIRPTFTKTFF